MDNRTSYRKELDDLQQAWSARGCLLQLVYFWIGGLVIALLAGLVQLPSSSLLELGQALPDSGIIFELSALALAVVLSLLAATVIVYLGVLGFDVPWSRPAKVVAIVLAMVVAVALAFRGATLGSGPLSAITVALSAGVAYWVGRGLVEVVRRRKK